MLPTTGSTNHAGDRGPCSAKAASRPAAIVVRSTSVSRGGAGGDARRIGHAQRGGRTARRHQQAIDVAVIIAGELDDHVAPGEAAGQANGAHRGFGARVDQPHLLDRRHGLDNQLGQLVFGQRRRAEAGAAADGRLEGRRRPPDGHGPGSSGPRSRCNRCSGCRRYRTDRPPRPRSMNSGSPPTPPNARAGLFTPPGISSLARANAARLFSCAMIYLLARRDGLDRCKSLPPLGATLSNRFESTVYHHRESHVCLVASNCFTMPPVRGTARLRSLFAKECRRPSRKLVESSKNHF